MSFESIDSGTGVSELSSNEINAFSTLLPTDQPVESKQAHERLTRCACQQPDTIVSIFTSYDGRESNSCSLCYASWQRLHQWIFQFVHSKYFDSIILSAILINTFTMSIEYHGQPQTLTNVLEYSNYVFIVLFTVEMILKIIADGCLKYIQIPFNIFDSTIVFISLIELYGANSSGLVVLRTFRLLRVLKLIRFMPTLRRQFVSERRSSSRSMCDCRFC